MNKLFMVLVLLLAGCTGLPDNVRPVNDFKAEKYLGKWYEIARLDQSFERGLTHITAEYSLRDDGGLKVLNRGYSASENKWQEAEGKAYFVGDPSQAHLKVSFFGPIYGSYIVFELDRDNYQYALVSGPDKSYLWLLAREPKIKDDIKKTLIAKAASLGFDTSKLIFVDQN
ncbi:MAG: lipocalin family protein [Methylococcales bacterium]|nr:lipocalin family protein [Methylococcales bacterium]MDP3839582.1 lipocalin family protein [Methylococcales bacterium]